MPSSQLVRPPAVRPLAVAVGTAVVVGLVTAVATVATTADLDGAAVGRAVVALVPAVLWPLLLRRTARGRTRAYARIRRVSVVVATVLAVALVTGGGPGWLRALQGAQVLTQLGVLAVALRPDLRAWYAAHRDDPELAGTWKPVLLLAVLSPLVAEVTIGDLPFTGTGLIAAAFTLPIYGAGAVLVRELVRWTGRGWPSILLLGLAFAGVEEGLGLQSFFDPAVYGGIGTWWGARVLDVNGTYVVVQLVNHAVWSVAVPILLTELAFPARRSRPFLRGPGRIAAGLLYAVGAGLVLLTAQTGLDPGYRAPLPLLVGTAVLVVALVVVALRVVPRPGPRVPTAAAVPPPRAVAATALVAALVFLGVLVLPGDAHAALMRGPGVVAPLVVALAAVVATAVLVARWSAAAAWDDRHALALAGGALVGHTAVWGLTQPRTWPDRAGVAVLLVLTVALLAVLARRAVRRPALPA